MSKRPQPRARLLPRFMAALFAASLLPAAPSSPTSESMSGFAEAIRLEEQISREKVAWDRQKRILENEIGVLRSELDETRRRIETIRADRTDARQRREELLGNLNEERERAAALDEIVSRIAEPFRSLLGEMPAWSSIESIRPDSIDEETSPIRLFRLLQEIQAENLRISLNPMEVANPETGEIFRVDVLSFGLGAGFFASEDGSFGGRFVYDGEAWTPEIIQRYAQRIRLAIEQEQGTAEPGLVLLPIALEGQP